MKSSQQIPFHKLSGFDVIIMICIYYLALGNDFVMMEEEIAGLDVEMICDRHEGVGGLLDSRWMH